MANAGLVHGYLTMQRQSPKRRMANVTLPVCWKDQDPWLRPSIKHTHVELKVQGSTRGTAKGKDRGIVQIRK